MRVSYNWLREYVPLELSPTELAEKLTMAGIAVEEVEDFGAAYRNLRVGQILEIKAHPRADNLLICRVRLSDGEVMVITAAKNLKPGDKVPVILPGQRLPNGKLIQETEFRGVLSQGMLCSEEELGLARESEGIMVLEKDTALDSDLAKLLGFDDMVLVLELTPNRADCYGMLGVAREAAAISGQKVKYPDLTLTEEEVSIEDCISVVVEDPELCPRYAGRVFFDVKVGESPRWLKTRLLAAGMRPINNVVDLTNYVMLELNQPLHAFDLDRLKENQIVVRRAKKGEVITTLDGVERVLDDENLLIADAEQGQCIAGVMGGCISEVSPDTRRVFLEAAHFSAVSIRRTSQKFALRSEAALRFGKGIDPAGVVTALDRTAHLLLKLGIGKVASGVIDYNPNPVKPRKVRFRPERINALLGTELSPEYIRETLNRLTFTIEEEDGQPKVKVPSYRPDIENEADLAEEVARIYGYNRIPTTYPAAESVGILTPRQRFEARVKETLQGFGLTEVMTYSFHGRKVFDRLNLPQNHMLRNAVEMKAPLSEEGSLMRTTLLAGTLETLSYNAKRNREDLYLYELARVYRPTGKDTLPDEPLYLAGALMGRAYERGWNQPARAVDFYDGKGMIEALLRDLQVSEGRFVKGSHPTLHPGRTAVLEINGKAAGVVGEVHPQVRKEYDLAAPAVLFELNMETLWSATNRSIITVRPLPKFPPVLRDLAVVLREEIPVAEILKLFREVGGEWLETVELFDVYQGEKIPAGLRSLAFSLTFRLEERTLQDEEVNTKMNTIIEELERRFDASIRQ